MAEPGSIAGKTGKFALARATFLKVLEAERIAEAHDVRGYITCKQHPSALPHQRDLPRAMPGEMNHFEAARDI